MTEPPKNRKAEHLLLRFNIGVLALGTALLLVRLFVPAGQYGMEIPYVSIQFILSVSAIPVILIGLQGYLRVASRRLLFLGLAFLTFSLLDALHAIAAPGGISFILADDENVSLWLWETGRLAGSALLLASVLAPESDDLCSGHPVVIFSGIVAVLALAVILFAAAPLLEPILPNMWNGHTTTGLKAALEVVAATLQVVVAVAYLQRYLRTASPTLLWFALGLVSLAIGGLALSSYHDFYDVTFWVGFAYRVIASCCFTGGVYLLAFPGSD